MGADMHPGYGVGVLLRSATLRALLQHADAQPALGQVGRRRGAIVTSTDNNNVVPFLCANLLNLSYHSLFKLDNTNLPFREITIKAHVWENTLYFYVCQPVESGTGGIELCDSDLPPRNRSISIQAVLL